MTKGGKICYSCMEAIPKSAELQVKFYDWGSEKMVTIYFGSTACLLAFSMMLDSNTNSEKPVYPTIN